ncbi:MAG: carbon starvation CstA 5TM domain-containing protein, partial [Candidatus Brocadiia bacterium]|nr:carbon starvation CstA 5TM domain-containing protein [Candidatus Brocadiia bacterium]
FGALIGITMLKTFVMTTLDSATRISRYVATELLGETFGLRAFRNRYVATLLVGVCGGAVALVGYQTILLVFGSANQLIGALALIVVTGYLTTRGRRWLYAAVPAVLVLLTTAAALVYQLMGFLRPPEGKAPNYGLAVIALSLLALALFVTCKGVATVAGVLRGRAAARVAPGA